MKNNQKSTSKAVFLGIAFLLVLIIGLFLYNLLRFKPLEPQRDEAGNILSTPVNGFRYFETSPTRH